MVGYNDQDKLSAKQSVKFWSKLHKAGLLVLAVTLAAMSIFTWQAQAATKTSKVSLYLDPSTKKTKQLVPFTVTIWEDSNSQNVNAIQTNLTYDNSKLAFLGINAYGSKFEIKAEETGGNGFVNIAKGHVGILNGKQYIAKVTFIPRVNYGKTNINFSNDSAVVRASDNTDILAQKSGGQYTLSRL